MPYSMTKLPASAKNLTKKQKEIFVATANGAIKDGKSDVDAIVLGLGAAKKHKEKHTKKSLVDELADKLAVLLTSTFGLDGGSRKDVEPTVEVTKAVDVEQRRAMFVVLAPNEIDEHGDTNTEDCVEKACISFNSLCNKANLFHRVNTEKAKIEQSFITPVGFTTDTGVEVKKGSWLQWWQFPEGDTDSELLWTMVKNNEIQGVSIGATAVYQELNNE